MNMRTSFEYTNRSCNATDPSPSHAHNLDIPTEGDVSLALKERRSTRLSLVPPLPLRSYHPRFTRYLSSFDGVISWCDLCEMGRRRERESAVTVGAGRTDDVSVRSGGCHHSVSTSTLGRNGRRRTLDTHSAVYTWDEYGTTPLAHCSFHTRIPAHHQQSS